MLLQRVVDDFLQQQTTGIMGPGVRRDGTGGVQLTCSSFPRASSSGMTCRISSA